MKVAVCQASPEMQAGDKDWQQLVESVQQAKPEMVLLNEMPFGPWISAQSEVQRETLLASQQAHEAGIKHLSELGAGAVLTTRPIFEATRSVNQAFIWQATKGITPVHTKQFFPNEEEFYEARWFERGETNFRTGEVEGVKIGFMICTEVMFNEWARHYGRQGAHIIAVPRATSPLLLPRWKIAIAMAAIVSGCYVISSNRSGQAANGQQFGGHGWIFNPYGELIAETSVQSPVACAEIDLALVERAQQGYPCYVADLPSSKAAV